MEEETLIGSVVTDQDGTVLAIVDTQGEEATGVVLVPCDDSASEVGERMQVSDVILLASSSDLHDMAQTIINEE